MTQHSNWTLGDAKYLELKPCPFCGGSELDVREVDSATGKRHSVFCGSCWAFGPAETTEKQAMTEWNSR